MNFSKSIPREEETSGPTEGKKPLALWMGVSSSSFLIRNELSLPNWDGRDARRSQALLLWEKTEVPNTPPPAEPSTVCMFSFPSELSFHALSDFHHTHASFPSLLSGGPSAPGWADESWAMAEEAIDRYIASGPQSSARTTLRLPTLWDMYRDLAATQQAREMDFVREPSPKPAPKGQLSRSPLPLHD